MAAVVAFAITVIFMASVLADAPSLAWNKTIKQESISFTDVSIVAVDDGYVIAARDLTDDHANMSLIKMDREGNVIWNHSYDGFYEIGSLIAVDDGYVVTGATSVYLKNYSYFVPKSLFAYLAKFDRNGNLTWWKMYDWWTDHDDIPVIPVSGGYVLAGTLGSVTIVMNIDAHLIKTDLEGNEIWNRSYGHPVYHDDFYTMQASDDGYIIGGQTAESVTTMNGTTWLLKTDSEGKEIWNMTYGKGLIYSMANASDGYVLLAKTPSGYHLIKTDKKGNEIWDRYLGDYRELSLTAVPDGYVVTGDKNDWNHPDSPVFLLKTDLNGNQLWNTTYDFSGVYYRCKVIYDRGAYVIVGLSRANISENRSIFLLKTRPEVPAATPATSSPAATPATNVILATLSVMAAAVAIKARK